MENENIEEAQTPTPRNNNLMVAGIAIVAVVALGFFVVKGMGSSSSESTLADTDTQAPAAEEVMDKESSNSVDTETVRTIEIEAGSFYYKPNEIRVKKGETVKIVIKSVDMMHDFVVDELKIKSPITKSGESNTFTLKADKAGTYEYYCSVGQHRKNGQVGTLVVE